MHTRITLILIVAMIASGCSNPEEEARVLQNKAITLENNNQLIEAKSVYESIVEKYPQTQSSIESNKALTNLESKLALVYRTIVTECLNNTAVAKLMISEWYEATGKVPGDAEMAEMLESSSVATKNQNCTIGSEDGNVLVTFTSEPLVGKTITLKGTFKAGRVERWSCLGGTFPQQYLPKACRLN